MPTPGTSGKELISCRIVAKEGGTGKPNIPCILRNQGTTEAFGIESGGHVSSESPDVKKRSTRIDEAARSPIRFILWVTDVGFVSSLTFRELGAMICWRSFLGGSGMKVSASSRVAWLWATVNRSRFRRIAMSNVAPGCSAQMPLSE